MSGLAAPYEPGHGKQWGLLQALASEPKYLSTYSGLFMNVHPLASLCPNLRINPFRAVQLSLQRVYGRAPKWPLAKPLSSIHWLLWFAPVSIQVVSVSGWVVTAVHVGRLPQPEPPQCLVTSHFRYLQHHTTRYVINNNNKNKDNNRTTSFVICGYEDTYHVYFQCQPLK